MYSTRRKALFMDPLPLSSKTFDASNSVRTKAISIPKENVSSTPETEWQTSWMNMYHSARAELNQLLEKERNENLKNIERIGQLEEKVKFQKILLTEMKATQKKDAKVCIKRSQATQTYIETAEKCFQISVSTVNQPTQTQTQAEDNSTQTQSQAVDNSTQTHAFTNLTCIDTSDKNFQQDESIDGQHVNMESISHDHFGYVAHIPPLGEPVVKKEPRFKCQDCGVYSTDKKSSFDVHCEENCVREIVKDMKCPICDASFNYRGLRNHLNHYVQGKTTPRGRHGKHSRLEHKSLLENLKEEKERKRAS